MPPPSLEEIAAFSAEFDWIIVAGGYDSLQIAQLDAARFAESGYQLIILWQQGQWRSAIFGYASRDAADGAAEQVRREIRDTAYVRQTSQWCPNISIETNYLDCGNG